MIQDFLLAPIWNGTQFFDAAGNPLAGGKIGTFIAGSMTAQAATYTDSTGSVANLNPIVLDSSGRIPGEIWVALNSDYQFVLFKPDGETVIMACDNVGVHDPYPDQLGHAGEYLQTDGTDVQWASVTPGGSAPQEFMAVLTTYPEGNYFYADGGFNDLWTTTVYQESTECTVNDFAGTQPIVFTLSTPGMYKVTVTGKIQPVGYPYAPLTDYSLIYGSKVNGAVPEFDFSTHPVSSSSMYSWSSSSVFNQAEFTDVFYVPNYNSGAEFSVAMYAQCYDYYSFSYYCTCYVSAVRTSGSVWPQAGAFPEGAFVYDSFSGVNGTPIVSHTGESGVTWTEGSGETHMIANGMLMGIQRTGSDTRLIPSAGVTGDWFFETEIYINNVSDTDYITVYQNSDQAFLFDIYAGANGISFGNESWVTPSFSAGNSYVIRFDFIGTNVELFIDGVSQGVDSNSFTPTGIISFDVWNSFPIAVGDPVIDSPNVDQQYNPNTSLYMKYVQMSPILA